MNRGYAVRSIEVTRADHPTTRQNQPIQIDERTSHHNPANDQRPPSPPTPRPPAKTLAKINPWRVSGLPWPYPSKDIYERYGYLYSEGEIDEWAPKIRDLAAGAETTHVLFNNCYRNYAQVNAQQLEERLVS